MDQVKVIAFVGMPGAGKSYCVDYLVKKGFPSVYFGGITVDEVKNRGMEVNEMNEKTVREELRANEGLGVMANRIIKKIDALAAQGQHKVVADGLYSWTEYKIFKDRYGKNVTVIAIAAPRHLRHDRLTHLPVKPFTDDEVTSREYAEIENIEKGGPIANADYTIVNDGRPETMLNKLDTVLTEIGF